MKVEIERKFLLATNAWQKEISNSKDLWQAYLCTDKERSIRIRHDGAKAYITIKGAPQDPDARICPEFEYEIPLNDAKDLLNLCVTPVIEKTRHDVLHKGLKWEIDVYKGKLAGLVVAEIELQTADQSFDCPDWLGAEITLDPAYKNANLAKSLK